jgi:DNA invertase Pin-like site-specific DNA recombinase
MSALLVGYARCTTDQQDLTAQQRDALLDLGVEADRIYVDHGLTGTTVSDPASARHWPRAGPATRCW